ncbi:conserved hypothetical protein [Oenococcus oeni]|nr:conserved hypothetical protein [Oenococcus oeni]SYW15825.1 conserved hypothetical protein [Oenococcus oeni]
MHPLKLVLFFSFVICSIQQVTTSHVYEKRRGYEMFSIVAAFDLICVATVLFNSNSAWIPLFIFSFIINIDIWGTFN